MWLILEEAKQWWVCNILFLSFLTLFPVQKALEPSRSCFIYLLLIFAGEATMLQYSNMYLFSSLKCTNWLLFAYWCTCLSLIYVKTCFCPSSRFTCVAEEHAALTTLDGYAETKLQIEGKIACEMSFPHSFLYVMCWAWCSAISHVYRRKSNLISLFTGTRPCVLLSLNSLN